MIKTYLLERKSWILLFLSLHGFILFIAFIDSAIPFKSILYIVFLNMLIFLFFLAVRYNREAKYYQSLQNWDHHLDLSNLTEADSPFEKIIESSLSNQTALLKQESAQHLLLLEQEKDHLLAWIHEVKTPLTALHLMIDRIEDEALKSQMTYEWLRIHLLLDTQLHQKRMPFIKNDLYIEKTDLQTIIFKEIKTLQSWCIQKGIGVDVDLEVKEVLTDAKWLAFIIRQLLTNAVKYSEHSDMIIKSYIKEGQTVLEVTDFGRGIDSKDISRIFDKGFTSTTKHQDNTATGMGLYLTKKIAEPLMLKIGVHSKLGKGTTFTITFPDKNAFHHITGV